MFRALCAHHQEVKTVLYSIWYHHTCRWPSGTQVERGLHGTATYRCDDTRCCIIQFWPPDDENICSKHVEAWNKTYCETKMLCIKLVNYWDKYTEMQHGQQNVKKLNLCFLVWSDLHHKVHTCVKSKYFWKTLCICNGVLYFYPPPFFYTHTAGIICYFSGTMTATNRAKLSAFKTRKTRPTFPIADTVGFFIKPICTKLLDYMHSLRCYAAWTGKKEYGRFRGYMILRHIGNYRYASLKDEDTFWEMRRCANVYLQKLR